MTDRVNGLTVYLEHDIRVDDVEFITNAITMIKGVLKVEHVIVDSAAIIAEERGRMDVKQKLYEFLRTTK